MLTDRWSGSSVRTVSVRKLPHLLAIEDQNALQIAISTPFMLFSRIGRMRGVSKPVRTGGHALWSVRAVQVIRKTVSVLCRLPLHHLCQLPPLYVAGHKRSEVTVTQTATEKRIAQKRTYMAAARPLAALDAVNICVR